MRAFEERVGDNLWRSKNFLGIPDPHALFPRVNYALLVSPSGRSAYILGGLQGTTYKNDAWKLRLSATGASWIYLSPAIHRSLQAHQVNSRWAGRERLSACAAYAGCVARPPRAIYVIGGTGARGLFSDVWVSGDGGATWTCQCSEAPWDARADAGLIAVRGRHERLVLCGGKGRNEYGPEMKSDVWVSEDAGATWFQIRSPSWSPRCLPLMYCFEQTVPSRSKLLIVGGKRADEMWSGGTVIMTPFFA